MNTFLSCVFLDHARELESYFAVYLESELRVVSEQWFQNCLFMSQSNCLHFPITLWAHVVGPCINYISHWGSVLECVFLDTTSDL